MDDGIEGETVPPGLSEVLDIDSGVFVGCFLGPSQKCFLRRKVLLANNNVRDLKKKRKTISTGNDGNRTTGNNIGIKRQMKILFYND